MRLEALAADNVAVSCTAGARRACRASHGSGGFAWPCSLPHQLAQFVGIGVITHDGGMADG